MSIFGRIFRRKRKEIPEREIKPLPPPVSEISEAQKITMENIKARLDLVLAELDSIKTQNKTLDERLKMIEKTLNDMRGIKYY